VIEQEMLFGEFVMELLLQAPLSGSHVDHLRLRLPLHQQLLLAVLLLLLLPLRAPLPPDWPSPLDFAATLGLTWSGQDVDAGRFAPQ